MITQFWNWLYTSVSNALNILNTMYSNATMKPFFDLLIIIVAVGVIMRYIIMPMVGDRGSDKAKRKDEDE